MDAEKRKYVEKNMLKISNKIFNLERWLSGLKRQTVNLLSFLIIGSNPILFYRNIAQFGSAPVLGTGGHVFKSHYFEIFCSVYAIF